VSIAVPLKWLRLNGRNSYYPKQQSKRSRLPTKPSTVLLAQAMLALNDGTEQQFAVPWLRAKSIKDCVINRVRAGPARI
jgi:hypothetical protein